MIGSPNDKHPSPTVLNSSTGARMKAVAFFIGSRIDLIITTSKFVVFSSAWLAVDQWLTIGWSGV